MPALGIGSIMYSKDEKDKLFEELYMTHYYKVLHFAFQYLNDAILAENVVQEVFTSLWKNIDHIDINRNVVSYLLTSAKHKALNILSKENYRTKYANFTKQQLINKINMELLQDDVSSEILQMEISNLLSDSYKQMPQKVRETFIMCRIKGYKHKEAAQILGVSEKTIEFRISKAMMIIRKTFRDYLPLVVLLTGALLLLIK